MDKNFLKKFASDIRNELIQIVGVKLDYLLLLDMNNLPNLYLEDNRENIIKIKEISREKGKENFIEEIAYTWFNRFVALRYMDIHNVTEIKVVSPIEGQTMPQIFSEATAGNINEKFNLDKKAFFNLIDRKTPSRDPDNEAYRMLFIAVCNYYHEIMPFMFEKIKDFSEILLPDDLLSPNSIRAKIVNALDEENCKDVEIIGWLYQFYISEKKDEVYTGFKKNKKISHYTLPAATQLFTPHWIVRYMVENSLGKLWLLNHPESNLKEYMKYFIESDEKVEDFIKISSPEDIKILDPCCGSGHILVYAFDLLTKIYEEQGYSKSEIPFLILKNNLFGADVDRRAASLANFALLMKASNYHRRFFRKFSKDTFHPHIIEIKEFQLQADKLFENVKLFGSLLNIDENKSEKIEQVIDAEIDKLGHLNKTKFLISDIRKQSEILSGKYHCVITNPPYMGSKSFNKELSDFVKKYYPDSKSDLFACFIERCLDFTMDKGFTAMITMQSWMFLSSYEKLRVKILKNNTIKTLAHLGNMVMGIAFGTSAFILQKIKPTQNSSAVYFKIDLKDLDENKEIKFLR